MKKNITFVINKAELVKYIVDSCRLSGSLISSHNASISFNEYTEQITVTIEDKEEDNY